MMAYTKNKILSTANQHSSVLQITISCFISLINGRYQSLANEPSRWLRVAVISYKAIINSNKLKALTSYSKPSWN